MATCIICGTEDEGDIDFVCYTCYEINREIFETDYLK
jgi:NMD protein affecting ribosome stability and mRNA decay